MSLFEKSPARPEPAIPSSAPHRAEPGAAAVEKTTVFGSHTAIQGAIAADEDIVIEGRLEGKVTDSKSLRVGLAAQVLADLDVKSVVIAGHVIGNVTASERVELLATGSLEGDIRAPKVVIADGATFKGSVDMGKRP